MWKVEPSWKNVTDRPVLPWPIVAGAFLHFALPAYLLIGLACGAVGLLDGLTPPDLAAWALPYSVRFAVAYLILAVIATAAAAVLDPPLRRRQQRRVGRDPGAAERQSQRNLAGALTEGRARLDRDAVSALDGIAGIAWQHAEPAFQSISADLVEVIRTSVAAMATATPQRRQELATVTTATLTRIAATLRDLQEQRGRLDEGDLRVVARYIDSRYPPSDYASDSVQ
ncbi:hypothetical protein [Sphingomonas sp. CROZ-RG-20F-R02-07]|uniref:hypothetical protein n=1 Tax=Sphingomonas sp. CROZ-RG-20F-R02-07 TaxID=2914832 RepID=UPI001F589ED2|nr:hypothetical protein [Sphingomonas sp. CROZ-RG-20F-R02-07]